MAVLWRQMTAVAIAGGTLLLTVNSVWSGRLFVQSFVVLWLIQFVVWAAWSIFVYLHFTSPLRHLPQPGASHWLHGHRRGMHPSDIGIDARKWLTSIKHGHFIRFLDYFNHESLLVTSPEAIAEVLVSKNYMFPKSPMIRFVLGRYTGHGIGAAEGDEHKAQRRIFSLAFSLRNIKDLYPTFWAKGGEAVQALISTAGRHANKSTVVEIHSWAMRCTLDVVGTASMGVEFGTIHDENHVLIQSYSTLDDFQRQDGVLVVLGTYLPEFLVTRIPLRRNREIDDALKPIQTACWNGIQAKKKMSEQQHTRPDICSVALESGYFSDEDLVEQLMVFLFAGQHAIAKTLTAAIYALCVFPDKQDRLREEVRSKLPLPGGAGQITSTDVDSMPYLNAVCKEVLRKYSVGVSSREAVCDTTIQGQVVPKGTTLKLAVCGINADPSLWGDDASSEFKPERWLSAGDDYCASADKRAGGGATSNYAFMTFMHGPQSCIAARFAQAEFACLLAAWVSRLEFSLHDKSLMDERKLATRALQTSLDVRIRVLEE